MEIKNKNKNNDFYYFTYGAIVPIIVAFSIIYVGKMVPNNLWLFSKPVHNVYKALLIGFLISLISYYLIDRVIKGKKSFSKSALLGLLAAEILIFVNEESTYSIATITLFLFVYFFSVEKFK